MRLSRSGRFSVLSLHPRNGVAEEEVLALRRCHALRNAGPFGLVAFRPEVSEKLLLHKPRPLPTNDKVSGAPNEC